MIEREDKTLETMQGKFQAGMWALSTASENCAKVIRRLGWAIWISSDCLWDLDQLDESSAKNFMEEVQETKGLVAKTVQFLLGDGMGPQEYCLEKLHKFSRELETDY